MNATAEDKRRIIEHIDRGFDTPQRCALNYRPN